MTRKFLFNVFVVLVFAALVIYSLVIATAGHWDKATYILVLAIFIFSQFIDRGLTV